MALVLLGMGFDALSMGPRCIPRSRQRSVARTAHRCARFADEDLALPVRTDVERMLSRVVRTGDVVELLRTAGWRIRPGGQPAGKNTGNGINGHEETPCVCAELCSDHHTGLVLARKAREAARELSKTRVMHGRLWWHAFKPNWSRILRLRKRALGGAVARGETDLVERTLTEHEDIAQLDREDRPENLARFARNC